MREFVKQMAASLREDETWQLSESQLRLVNDKLKVELWIGWPRLLTVGVREPARVDLTLLERVHLYRPVSIALRAARTRRRKLVDVKLTEYIVTRRLNTPETN